MHGELSDKTDDKGGINHTAAIRHRNQNVKPNSGRAAKTFIVLCYAMCSSERSKMHTFELQSKAFFKGPLKKALLYSSKVCIFERSLLHPV